jgi:hypothetical protein
VGGGIFGAGVSKVFGLGVGNFSGKEVEFSGQV